MSISDSALFHQFSKYLEEDEKKHDVQKRDISDKASKIQKQMEEFLRDVYPGMKQMPNDMIELMTSPNPDQTLSAQANLVEKRCKADTASIKATKKEKRSADSAFDSFGCPKHNEACYGHKANPKCPNFGWPIQGQTNRKDIESNTRKCIGIHVSILS